MVDWGAFWWLPSDVFGPGKVLMIGEVMDQNNKPYEMDTRGLLKSYVTKLHKECGYTVYAANEVEGFLLKGEDAEKNYNERVGLEIAAGKYPNRHSAVQTKRYNIKTVWRKLKEKICRAKTGVCQSQPNRPGNKSEKR